MALQEIKNIQDIQHIFYINLEHRKDRKIHAEQQLLSLGFSNQQIQRFPALCLSNGALGCSMSHLKCVQTAKDNKWPHVLICEDDIQFLNPELFINQINLFFSSKKSTSWDVLLLAGNNMLPYKKESDHYIQVHRCLTTTGYIVQSHYYDTLIENYKQGILQLIKNPENKNEYAIDKFWLSLQKRDNWFLTIPLSVVQREDFSDIEKKVTNFNNYMLNYNKAYK
jgi:GR25 family glycosyltransferase involved in LPS biosynthesis